ncbi:MAG: helix-hairpin-helix domain-containing protein [Beutenbergiaceae bacterium]
MPKAGHRLQRYLRAAYDGQDTQPISRRWAIAAPTAIVLAIAILALGLVAAGWFALNRPADPAPVPSVAPPVSAPATAPTPSSTSQSGLVAVHVAGAVAQPGVVEVASGTRVVAAIEAAGGARPDADLDALNLAAPVVDGQQVYVPVVGEHLPSAGGANGDGAGGAAPGTGSGLIDINSADAGTLESLPGIGPALAQRIVEWRDDHGRFDSLDALTQVSGIGPATVDRLRDHATV